MHFTILNAFAATVAIALSEQCAAIPIRNPGIISLPLRSVRHPARDRMDPVQLFQSHNDHSEKRFAKLAGRDVPSDEQIRAKRDVLTKRFNRHGVNDKRLFYSGTETPTSNANNAASTEDDTIDTSLDLSDDGVYFEDGAEIHVDVINDCDESDPSDPNSSNSVPAAPPATSPDTAATTTAAPAQSPDPAPADPSPPVPAPPAGSSAAAPQSSSAPSDTDNIIKLEDIGQDVGYFAVVQIGTPARDFKILMDSGSSDFWVGSEDCKAQQGGGGCGPHVFLGQQSSSSFQMGTEPFQVKYGTGFASGVKVKDTLSIGGMKMENHDFGVAQVESPEFAGDSIQFDGLMGLALSSLSNQKVPTPVESLAKQGLIKEAITSYKISRKKDNKDDGTIDFGGLDESKFDASSLVTIDNVSKNGFWEATVDSVAVGGKDLGLTGRTAILDTGTTLILAPTDDAVKIHQQIPNSRQDGDSFIIPCDTNAQVQLTFGGKQFTIDPRDLAFAQVGNNECKSGINAGKFGDSPTQYLVGDVFLKSAYYSTNVNQNKISLAHLV